MNKLAILCAIAALSLMVAEAMKSSGGAISLDDARRVRCTSDIRQMQIVLGMYHLDHDEYPRSTRERTWHEVLVGGGYLPDDLLTGNAWLDPWGNAYDYLDRAYPEKSWSSACQSPRVFSIGVNGIDEGGEGDDVLVR